MRAKPGRGLSIGGNDEFPEPHSQIGSEQAFRAAAVAEMADAQPLRDNGFKIELTKRTLVAVLGDLSGAAA